MRPFKFCRLEADTELKGFKSIDDDLNDFLLNDAKNYNEELLAVTYLMIDAETEDIIAYYSSRRKCRNKSGIDKEKTTEKWERRDKKW